MSEKTLSEMLTSEDHGLTDVLSRLPHKILKNYDVDGLSEIVLHELGHDSCFGLKRAIYLVDNPDFNRLVGVAGFCRDECKFHKQNVWEDPRSFRTDMQQAQFHATVRTVLKDSLRRNEIDFHDSNDLKELGEQTGMKNPHTISWHMKHGNHGVLIVEKEKEISPWRESRLENATALLGLCGAQ